MENLIYVLFAVITALVLIIIKLLLVKSKAKGGEEMGMCYAILIIRGYRTFASVPKVMKQNTADYLIALDAAFLLPEEYRPKEEENEEKPSL